MEEAVESTRPELARTLEVLANPTRLELLHRLGRPAFAPDLVEELGLTRQALKKHLDALEQVGLIVGTPGRRGALRATEYVASPAGLFAFKVAVQELAIQTDPSVLPPRATMPADENAPHAGGAGAGLLLVHGDRPGRWFGFYGQGTWVIGRDPDVGVSISYDAFASSRHALLRRGPAGWTLSDLDSTNGTRVNFRPIARGATVNVRSGDLLTVGRTHLLLRDGG